MGNLTCEEVSRIYERLGLFKTTSAVRTLVAQGSLITDYRTNNDRRYSIYSFRINTLSFIKYLKSSGFSNDDMKLVFPDYLHVEAMLV